MILPPSPLNIWVRTGIAVNAQGDDSSAARVILRRTSIQHCHATSGSPSSMSSAIGGAISIEIGKGWVLLEQSSIVGNVAQAVKGQVSGGGLVLTSGRLTLLETNISDCAVSSEGPGGGGAALVASGTLEMNQSYIDSCRATSQGSQVRRELPESLLSHPHAQRSRISLCPCACQVRFPDVWRWDFHQCSGERRRLPLSKRGEQMFGQFISGRARWWHRYSIRDSKYGPVLGD